MAINYCIVLLYSIIIAGNDNSFRKSTICTIKDQHKQYCLGLLKNIKILIEKNPSLINEPGYQFYKNILEYVENTLQINIDTLIEYFETANPTPEMNTKIEQMITEFPLRRGGTRRRKYKYNKTRKNKHKKTNKYNKYNKKTNRRNKKTKY
jgi:hypothetical protein